MSKQSKRPSQNVKLTDFFRRKNLNVAGSSSESTAGPASSTATAINGASSSCLSPVQRPRIKAKAQPSYLGEILSGTDVSLPTRTSATAKTFPQRSFSSKNLMNASANRKSRNITASFSMSDVTDSQREASPMGAPTRSSLKRPRSPEPSVSASVSARKSIHEQGRSLTKRNKLFVDVQDKAEGSFYGADSVRRLSFSEATAPPSSQTTNITMRSSRIKSTKRLNSPDHKAKIRPRPPQLDDLPPMDVDNDNSIEKDILSDASTEFFSVNGAETSMPSEEDVVAQMCKTTIVSEATELASVTSFRTPPSSPHKLFSPWKFHEGDTATTPLPPTPKTLDAKSKAAQIIADIKKHARERLSSSPDSIPPLGEFKDVLESSSDEETGLPWTPKRRGTKAPEYSLFGSPLTSLENSSDEHLEDVAPYNLRHRDPYPVKPKSVSTSQSRGTPLTLLSSRSQRSVILNNAEVVITKRPLPLKKKFDPLETLLREKRAADKKGKGGDALRSAEEALKVRGRSLMLEADADSGADSDDELGRCDKAGSDGGDTEFADEDAARIACTQGSRIGFKSSSPANGEMGDGNEDELLDEEERGRLLGEDNGRAVGKILEKDRRAVGEVHKVKGVQFWIQNKGKGRSSGVDVEMGGGEAKPTDRHTFGGHPVLDLLQRYQDENNTEGVRSILGTGILLVLDVESLSSVIPLLCDHALSVHNTPLRDSAFLALCHVWNELVQTKPGVPLPTILYSIELLGGNPEVMKSVGLDVKNLGGEVVDTKIRADVLYRIIHILGLSVRAGAIIKADIPDLVVLLLVIGMDPTCPLNIQGDVLMVLDGLFRALAPGDDIVDLELPICQRILGWSRSSGFEPINQKLLTGFLAGGAARTRRIARWVARGMLIEDNLSSATYTNLPPLEPLVELIYDRAPSSLFATNDETDYEDLQHRINILAIALSDIEDYVATEFGSKAETVTLESLFSEPKKALEGIHIVLDRLHGRIEDARSAHLDRSRAKATIQRVQMRVYYQRLSALKSGVTRGKNLRQYFRSTSKTKN